MKNIKKKLNTKVLPQRELVMLVSILTQKIASKFATSKFVNSKFQILSQSGRKFVTSYILTPRYSRLGLQFYAIVIASAAFTVGSFLAITGIIIPKLRALTETTYSMPTDSTFIASGYDTGSGTAFAISSEVRIATSSAWWNANWNDKKQLTLTNNSGSIATAGATMRVSIDTKALYDAGKLLSTGDDLRVVYSTASGYFKELVRSLTPASGTTISTSTSTEIAFPLQSDITNGSNDTNYYLYYGNVSASAYPVSSSAYSFDGVGLPAATFVAPFNGTTTAVGGQTPTTSTGAIRYSGSKSALSFDGVTDVVAVSSLSNAQKYNQLTIECWAKSAANTNHLYPSYFGNGGAYWTGEDTIQLKHNWNDSRAYAQILSNSVSYDVTNGASIRDGNWHHLALVINNTEARLYVDGVSGNPTTIPAGYRFYNSTIGDGWSKYDGVIDEFRISTSARYTTTFTPSTAPFQRDTDTKLLFHFDENGDDPRNTGKAIDDSGNGNHGTITGAKYVSGLVGVDASVTDTGNLGTQSYAAHSGVFIEEGTTNLITNPSFENGTYNLNWQANTFQLRDDFSTDEASPIVSPRTPVPGPGTAYTVTQSGSNAASVSGGKFNYGGPSPISSSFAGTISYANGRALFASIQKTSYDNSSFGLSSASWHIGGWGNNTINTPVGGFSWSLGLPPASYNTVSGPYRYGIVMTDTGYYWMFFDGNNWKLAWLHEQAVSGNQNWSFGGWNQSGNMDNLNVIDLPAPFNTINNFKKINTGTAGVNYSATGTADGIISATITAATGVDQEIYLRKSDASNKYIIRALQGSSLLKIIELNAGVETERASVAQTWTNATNYTIKIIYDGALINVYVDNAQKINFGSGTFNSTATGVGTGANGTYTTFYQIPRGNNGEYNSLSTIDNFVTLTASQNTTAPYYKFGSSSIKLDNTANSTPSAYLTTATATLTANNLSAFVYNGTSGSVGGTIDGTVAKLVFDGKAVTTTYADMGGGWWRLSYSGTPIYTTSTYGVQVINGKIVYLDGVQLENKSYATTYTDGSLGATGQYDWTGTANNSTSTRTGTNISYPTAGNWSTSGGSWSAWVKFDNLGMPDPFGRAIVTTGSVGSSGMRDLRMILRNANEIWFSNDFCCTNGFQYYPNPALAVGKWYHLAMTWDSQYVKGYFNGIYVGQANIGTVNDSGAITVGSEGNSRQMEGVISDLRILNQALTLSQVKSLYYEGLNSHSEGTESIDKYQANGTYTSPILDLTANGQWGASAWNATATLGGGTVSYLSRSSADNITWSDWAAISGSTIASDPRRYFQWKALLAAPAAKNVSPVVNGMTVSYVEDTTAPSNPETTGLGYSTSSTVSADLTTATWYNYATPKFTFDAGADVAGSGQSASGIAGYHILLTTDPTATPSANTGDPCYRLGGAEDRELIVGSKPATCTLSNGTYYLLMQTKDNSGNTSTPSQVFTYKYDGSIPNAPASVATTDIGYQATNAFTFYWPTATDVGPSGIIGYEYKTATTSGTWSEWQYTTATTVADVPAYTEGQNFFYVRSKDTAGNYSGQTSNNIAAGSFYYNASAPTAPLDIVLDPVSSLAIPASDNVFDVTWDKPASYSGEIAKYWYCVNCTPSVSTMTETTPAETVNRKLDNYALATQQGKNTFYLVAEDNNVNLETGYGNRNFSAYATADFYASTTAPGAPTNLTISDASDRGNSKWKLALAWDVPTIGGMPSNYEVYRSLDNTTFAKIGEVTGAAYTDTGLTQSTLYYYKVRSLDNAGSTSLYTSVVSKKPEGKYTSPASVGGAPSTTTGSTTATMVWTTSRNTYGTIEFGKTTGYGSAASETTAVSSHSVKLTGLTPGTEYHYRVSNMDDSDLVGYERSTAYSADFTFTTLAGAEITDVTIDETGLDTAIISWKTRTMASTKIDYGKTTNYGSSQIVSSSASESIHTARIAGLENSTTYHFRLKGTTIDGTDIYSDDYTFETITFPVITAYLLKTDQNAGGTTVALAWSTNVEASSVVEYQGLTIDAANLESTNLENLANMTQAELANIPVISNEEAQQLAKADLSTTHVMKVGSLKDGTMYVFTIKGRDKYGNEGISDPIRYVTGRDTRPPVISNVAVETQISGSGAASTAQILVSWDTDEPATSQVVFGSGVGTEYPSSTPEEAGLTLRHVVVIRDLQPTASYHLQIQSKDQTGNQVKSDDLIAVTPATLESALDVVLKNLEDVFGFLKL